MAPREVVMDSGGARGWIMLSRHNYEKIGKCPVKVVTPIGPLVAQMLQ